MFAFLTIDWDSYQAPDLTACFGLDGITQVDGQPVLEWESCLGVTGDLRLRPCLLVSERQAAARRGHYLWRTRSGAASASCVHPVPFAAQALPALLSLRYFVNGSILPGCWRMTL